MRTLRTISIWTLVAVGACLQGCATQAQWQSNGPLTSQARLAFLSCADARMASTRASGAAALDRATVAVASCESRLAEVRSALVEENEGANHRGTFADAFVDETRKRTTVELAQK